VRFLAGRYRLIEVLGSGGMSVVWRAYDEVLARQVAVKLLAAAFAADEASRDRLRAEAQAAACLSHPNVTNVYDYGECRGPDGMPTPYVVMELLEGVSLADRLERGALPWRTAVRVCAEVAAALGTAHARGLVHRDVKPANVMLTLTGVKVVDFGIAAVSGERADLVADGTLLGTPAYLAPERLLGAAVQPATDVYALGVMLYRALSGELPWQADTVTEMIKAHCRADPAPLPEIAGLPPEVVELCMRCLAKVPAERPTSTDLAHVLADAAGVPVVLPPAAVALLGPALGPDPAPSVDQPITVLNDHRPSAVVEADTEALLGVQAAAAYDAAEDGVADPTVADPTDAVGLDASGSVPVLPRHKRLTRAAAAGAGLVAAAMMVATCSDMAHQPQSEQVASFVRAPTHKASGSGQGAAAGGRTGVPITAAGEDSASRGSGYGSGDRDEPTKPTKPRKPKRSRQRSD